MRARVDKGLLISFKDIYLFYLFEETVCIWENRVGDELKHSMYFVQCTLKIYIPIRKSTGLYIIRGAWPHLRDAKMFLALSWGKRVFLDKSRN